MPLLCTQYFCCNAQKWIILGLSLQPGTARRKNQARAEYAEGGGSLSAGIRPHAQAMIIMAEVQSAAPKSKPKPVAAIGTDSKFEMPKFEMPKFEMPKFEIPPWKSRRHSAKPRRRASRRPMITTTRSRARPSRPPTFLKRPIATASKGCSGYGLKLIETTRANSNAAFDLFGDSVDREVVFEVVEKTTAYMRTQFDTVTAQAKELTEHAQKVATDTAEPLKGSISSFGKAA